MPDQKPIEQIKIESSLMKTVSITEAAASVLNNLIKYGFLIFVARYMYLGVHCLAGKVTVADFFVRLFSNKSFVCVISLLVGGGGVGYGVKQRKLRRDNIERLHARIKGLEADKDSGRSSSNLTPRGDTNKEDE